MSVIFRSASKKLFLVVSGCNPGYGLIAIPQTNTCHSPTSYRYQLNDTLLKHVPHTPYLGILLSHDLRWGDHIAKATKKANATLGFLR
jgi:hypothetical protein